MPKTILILLKLLLLSIYTNCLSVEVQVQNNSILSWINERGQTQKLLIYQMQKYRQINFQQIGQLNNDFLIKQFTNCDIIFSQKFSQIYTAIETNYYTFSYIYEVDQVVIDKGVQKVQVLGLDKQQSINRNSNSNSNRMDLLNSTVSINIYPPSEEEEEDVQNSQSSSSLLYLYNQNLLYSFDSALYSSNPTCYKLSQMTKDLCNIEQCQTLSPNNLIQNEQLRTKIDVFQIQNNKIFIIFNQPSFNNSMQFDFFFNNYHQHSNLDNSSLSSQNFTLQVKEAKLSFDSNIKITINVLNSQVNGNGNGNLQRILIESQAEEQTKSKSSSNFVSLQINLQNTQSTEQYGEVQILLDNMNILKRQYFFSPYQKISISLTMASESLMNIQLFDINHNLKSNYKFSIDNVIPLQKIIPEGNIVSSDTIITKGGLAGIIIAAVIGVVIIVLVLVKCYRKYKWCKQKTQEGENPQSEKKESGRDLKLQGLNSLESLPSDQVLTFDTNGDVLKKQSKNSQNPEQKGHPSTQQSEKAQTI